MAHPVPGNSSKPDIPSHDKGNLVATANGQAGGHGGSNPAQSGKPPTVNAATTASTTSSTSEAWDSSVLNLQPPIPGTTAVHGSQPVYGQGRTRSNIGAGRHVDPTQALVADFLSKLDPAALERLRTRNERMQHVTNVLKEFQGISTTRIRFVDLAVPMRECNSKSGMHEEMYSYALYKELSGTRLVHRLRVKDYQPALDRSAWLPSSAELVGNNPYIQWLELSKCKFNDDDADALAKGLHNNHAIKTLVVKNCNFSRDGWQALVGVFEHRRDIQFFAFPPTQIGPSTRPNARAVDKTGHSARKRRKSAQAVTPDRMQESSVNKTSLSSAANAGTTSTTTSITTTGTMQPGVRKTTSLPGNMPDVNRPPGSVNVTSGQALACANAIKPVLTGDSGST